MENKCHCGKKIGKYVTECKKCLQKRFDAIHKLAREIVKSGKCPTCGSGLKRNLALAGWYQCEQFGAEQFRKDPLKPACSFQTFTE